MSKYYKWLLCNLYFLTFFLSHISNAQNIDIHALDKYIEKSVHEWKIPGCAISIIKNDSVLFMNCYGIRHIIKGGDVTPYTMFAIASNTKAFTSASISILVDKELVSWDDKVIKYLPYLKLYSDYVTSEITIRDLLCHRAGYKTFSGDLLWYESIYTPREILGRIKYLKPAYGFRGQFGYSNIMYIAAGEIIEKISGTSYVAFVQENIFNPLGMSRSNFSIDELSGETNIAYPHIEYDGKIIPIEYMSWDNALSAAGINSCIHDMEKWIKLQLNNGEYKNQKILSEDQIWEMRVNHTPIKISKGMTSLWHTKHFEGYGLGWSLFDYRGRKIINHSGGADGMISEVTLMPEENLGFVILTNSYNYLPSALTYQILDMYFDVDNSDWSQTFLNLYNNNLLEKELRSERDAKERNPDLPHSLKLEEYCGKYRSILYGESTIEKKDNVLYIQFVPTPSFKGELKHWQKDVFTIHLLNTPTLPKGKVYFSINDTLNIVQEMLIDIPNPDFDFTELEFIKID